MTYNPTKRATARINRLTKDRSPEETVTNLLTDLRHFCHTHNINFHDSATASYNTYIAELNDRSFNA